MVQVEASLAQVVYYVVLAKFDGKGKRAVAMAVEASVEVSAGVHHLLEGVL